MFVVDFVVEGNIVKSTVVVGFVVIVVIAENKVGAVENMESVAVVGVVDRNTLVDNKNNFVK